MYSNRTGIKAWVPQFTHSCIHLCNKYIYLATNMCQVQCLFPGIRCLQINPHANLESLCPIVTSSDSPAGLSLPHQLHPQHSSCPNPFTQQMRTTSLPGTPAHSGVCRDSHVCVLRAHVPPLLGGTTSIPARRTPPAQTEAKC